eukprot:7043565-Prymnesium_polylepis.1
MVTSAPTSHAMKRTSASKTGISRPFRPWSSSLRPVTTYVGRIAQYGGGGGAGGGGIRATQWMDAVSGTLGPSASAAWSALLPLADAGGCGRATLYPTPPLWLPRAAPLVSLSFSEPTAEPCCTSQP